MLREGGEEKSGKSVKKMASMLVRGVAPKQATSGVKVKVTTSQPFYSIEQIFIILHLYDISSIQKWHHQAV